MPSHDPRLLGGYVLSDFAGELVKYLLVFVGALTVLLILILLSLMQISHMPSEISSVATFILSLPLVLDLIVISPNLPYLLVYVTLVPLFLVVVVIARIFAEELSRVMGGRRQAPKPGGEKKYGFWTLLAVSLGATVGPSAFVLTPYSVAHYGYQALLGMVLASASAVALAYGYSRMYYYSRRILGGRYVGGPSFVRNAFGPKHYVYIISRFTMWIGNVALASFNLLITIELLLTYLLPLLGVELVGAARAAAEAGLFAVLAALVLLVYGNWEKTVDLQKAVTVAFLALFAVHGVLLGARVDWSRPLYAPLVGALSYPDPWGLVWSVLSAAAYVYLMVFGFQEVQSLAENVEVRSRENFEEEVARKLMWSMVLGAGISGILFTAYMYLYAMARAGGAAIPLTPIPPLDMLRGDTAPYLVTLAALLLGVFTTYIPAFVAALKHLRELMRDVFLVEMEGLRISVDPYIVILFMGVLLLSNAEYIIRLTDFAVLASLVFVAVAEYFLAKRVLRRVSGWSAARVAFTAGTMLLVAAVFSVEMQDVAVNSVIFMLFATLAIMLFSYSLPIIEIFTLATVALSIVLLPPLIGVIRELAGYGLIAPSQVALIQVVAASSWILHLVLLSLTLHLAYIYRRRLWEAAKRAADIAERAVKGWPA